MYVIKDKTKKHEVVISRRWFFYKKVSYKYFKQFLLKNHLREITVFLFICEFVFYTLFWEGGGLVIGWVAVTWAAVMSNRNTVLKMS